MTKKLYRIAYKVNKETLDFRDSLRQEVVKESKKIINPSEFHRSMLIVLKNNPKMKEEMHRGLVKLFTNFFIILVFILLTVCGSSSIILPVL